MLILGVRAILRRLRAMSSHLNVNVREIPHRASVMNRRELLIFCALDRGGIAEHTHYQAEAAVRRGWEVYVLASS